MAQRFKQWGDQSETDDEGGFQELFDEVVASYADSSKPFVKSGKELPNSWSLRSFDDQALALEQEGVNTVLPAVLLNYHYRIGSRATHLNPITFHDRLDLGVVEFARDQAGWARRFRGVALLCLAQMLQICIGGRASKAEYLDDLSTLEGVMKKLQKELLDTALAQGS